MLMLAGYWGKSIAHTLRVLVRGHAHARKMVLVKSMLMLATCEVFLALSDGSDLRLLVLSTLAGDVCILSLCACCLKLAKPSC